MPMAPGSVSAYVAPKAAGPPKLLTARDVAQLMGCNPRTVYRMAQMGHMPKEIKIGGMIRWNRLLIEQWIEDGCPAQEKDAAHVR